MSSIVVLIVVALLAAAGYIAWSRRRPAKGHSRKSAPAAPRFAGVRIRVGTAACDAAHALADRHFLLDQAPALPLRGCTEGRCRCAFVKLSDRRTESRRWADEGIGAALFSAAERRKRADRRRSGA